MSWVNRIESGITITTGDGKEYTPKWKNAQKSFDFNISEFNFQDVAGTLVYRGQPMGRRYPIEIYFEGEDNIEQSNAFEESAKNKAPWTLSHPLYDDILVHPVSLKFDDTNFNSTKITGTLLETISDVFPRSNKNPKDQISQDFENTKEALADDFATNVPQPDTTVKDGMTANNNELYEAAKDGAKTSADAENFRSAYSTASSAILTATSEPLAAMRAANNVLGFPAQLQTTAQNRIEILKSNYDRLVKGIATITERNQKYVFESSASTIIAGMALAASTPQDGDYEKRSDVLNLAETITETFDDLIGQLDAIQTDNGGSENSYQPSPGGMRSLVQLYNYTIANLVSIALGSSQERTIILTSPDDVINLTHRFYGLDQQDQNLNRFISQNDIGIFEMIEIPSGREVTYIV